MSTARARTSVFSTHLLLQSVPGVMPGFTRGMAKRAQLAPMPMPPGTKEALGPNMDYGLLWFIGDRVNFLFVRTRQHGNADVFLFVFFRGHLLILLKLAAWS